MGGSLKKKFNVIFIAGYTTWLLTYQVLIPHPIQHPWAGGRVDLPCCLTVPTGTLCTGMGQQQQVMSAGIEPATSRLARVCLTI